MLWFRVNAIVGGLFAALASAGPVHAEAPRIVAVASSDGDGLTLGHVVTVTLCNLKDKAALDPSKLGLLLAGFRAADKPSTTLPKSGECELVGGKGFPVEMRYRVEYTHAKRKDWLTVFEARDGDLKAAIGLADENGKPIAIEIASAASTVILRRLLQWELWLFIGVAAVLVVGFVLLVLRSNLVRDGGDDLKAKWRRYLDDRYAAWSGKGFAAGQEREDLQAAMVASGAKADVAKQHLDAIAAAHAAQPAPPKNPAELYDAAAALLVKRIKPPYSLARLQMALWTIVIIAGLFLVYLITATIFQIPGSVLVLMGVSGATYLGARVLDARDPAAAPAPAAKPGPPARSLGIFTDVISDERGVALHRAQMLVWTLVMIALFLTELFRRLVFVEFDDTMLGLLGISNGSYLALKALEK